MKKIIHKITCEICDYSFYRDHSPEFKVCYWCEVDDFSDSYGVNDTPSDEEELARAAWLIG